MRTYVCARVSVCVCVRARPCSTVCVILICRFFFYFFVVVVLVISTVNYCNAHTERVLALSTIFAHTVFLIVVTMILLIPLV